MTQPPLIGVLGGYGAVGASAARCLDAWGGFRLRIGGRNECSGQSLAGQLGGPVEVMVTDATDHPGLARFTEGCTVVLNCAGPAYTLSGLPRRIAAEAGVDYVDVMDGAGPDAATGAAHTAVLSAGLLPGLSGLLPRLLAGGLAWPGRFTGYYAGLGTLTHTGAVDYLLSLDQGYGTPLACWRRGRVLRGELSVREGCTIAGLAHPVTAYPYLPAELVRQAETLGLDEASWYNAFDGHHLLDALNRYRAAGAQALDPDTEAAAIVRASALDALGRSPYHLLCGELEGRTPDGTTVRRTAVIRGVDGSALTGVVGAVVAREVALGRITPGTCQDACQMLPPATVLDAVRAHLPSTVVSVTEVAVPDPAAPEATGTTEIPGAPGITEITVEEGVL